ncbi:MAG: NifU family protein [Prevotellaceae bacterium]|jgi:Fe-S cluster biogenesis protein NfuA|nr:NifU family protein [Prevotellaceae bacterium]
MVKDIRQRVESALNGIRPYLKADGGNVVLVDITPKMVAKIKFRGACEGCSLTSITMKSVVEVAIKKEAPEIKEVEAV